MSDRPTATGVEVDPQLAGDHGVVVQHCAVFGRLETPVGRYRVGRPRPDARHPTSVAVVFLDPRTARRATGTTRLVGAVRRSVGHPSRSARPLRPLAAPPRAGVWNADGWNDPYPAAVAEDAILARLLALNGARSEPKRGTHPASGSE